MSNSLVVVNQEQIISKVAAGVLLKDIAKELGITPAAISNQLHNNEEYRKARETGAEMRLEQQYSAILESQDMLSVSRAREGFKAASWFAEREFPNRWGKESPQPTVTINLDSNLLGKASDLLNAIEPKDFKE